MTNSKLIFTLNTLDNAELRAFSHFLSCKLFNQRELPILLFDYLRKALKSKSPKLSKEIVFKALFPERPYKEKLIRDTMSYLSVTLEKFLAFQKLYEHQGNELIALCEAYRERNMVKQFEVAASKTASLQETSKLRDSAYHHLNYQLQQERYYVSTNKGRGHAKNLVDVTKSLDISYFANRLRQSCYMLSHESVYNVTYDFKIVEEIIEEVKRQQLLHIPAIRIYYYGYLAQVYPDNIPYFKALLKTLISDVRLFKVNEMREMYILAINIAIKRYNQGYRELVPDLLELYQSGIDLEILLTNQVLSRFTYKNVIALALTQKMYDWIEDFMETYTPLLEKEYREITFQYNLAKVHCEKKEFDKSLQYLYLLALSDDVYINIDTKVLLSRIYYEQHNIIALTALVDSFKKVLSRKKAILGYHHSSYRNFLNCLNKLIAINQYDRSAKKLLLKELEATKPLPYKHWFYEQLN